MLQVHPALSNEGVKILIEVTSADEVGDPAEDIPGFDNYMGYGRIQYEQAVSMAVFASTCTLACVAATESPTPIALLKPFYGLRDGKLRSTAIGRKLIADYYAATVGVAPVVSKDVKLMFRLLSCVKQYAPLIEQLKARPGAPVVLPRSLWAESCAIANLLLPKLNSGTRERVRPWIERGKRDPIGLLKEMEIPAVMQ